MIQQHVEAQNLKAGAACSVVGEAGVVVVFEDRVGRDESLYDHVLDVHPHLFCVVAHGLQVLVEGGQLPTVKHKIPVGKAKQSYLTESNPLCKGQCIVCWRK